MLQSSSGRAATPVAVWAAYLLNLLVLLAAIFVNHLALWLLSLSLSLTVLVYRRSKAQTVIDRLRSKRQEIMEIPPQPKRQRSNTIVRSKIETYE